MSKSLPPLFPQKSGQYAKQAHVDLPNNTFEDEHGRQGFFGKVSHLYHANAPTNWTRVEGNLIPHAYDLNATNAMQSMLSTMPQTFLENDDVRLAVYKPTAAMPHYARNGDGDELWFIHEGSGLLETEYGPLNYRPGDYIYIPRGTTYRFFPNTQSSKNQFYLLIESFSEYEIADRGSIGRHAFFDLGVIEIPEAKISTAPATHGKEWMVSLKRYQEQTEIFYPYNPLDVVGWKGDLFPWRLNVADIRPLMSPRYHLPPSVHTTLVAQGFVVCTFAPRPTETGDPKALRVPFFHRNIDYDEILFYHAGDFFSRTNIKPGMVTYHPIGIHHGPHPKALANQFSKEFADEYAVMIDARKPFRPGPLALASEMPSYKDSWKTP